MKRFLTFIISISSVLFLVSCGEDRTYEYVEKTQHNQWAWSLLQDNYLWIDSVGDYEPEWQKFFQNPSDFLSLITSKSKHDDKWSYAYVDTLDVDMHERGMFNHINSYGMDFELMVDPTGRTTKSVARVKTVYPNSPAAKAGLKRNDFIYSFDGYKLSSNNVKKLQSGVKRTLGICHIAFSAEDVSFYWQDSTEVVMEASRFVEDVAFPVDSIVLTGEGKVGYLMCARLVPGPEERANENQNKYINDLDAVMERFRGERVKTIVLDLRLCNYGTLDMACRLASYVIPAKHANSTFAKTFWNNKRNMNDATIPYNTNVKTLDFSKVYVIVGDYTQGAAEWMIHALQHTMGEENVVLIGTSTCGQNVLTEEVGSKYNVHLCPVVAYVADGSGDYQYGKIVPTEEMTIDEMTLSEWAEYGSPDEYLFHTALKAFYLEALW